MILTPQELAAAARRQKDFDQLMLEISGFTNGHAPRFLRPEQIERIRRETGMSAETALSDHDRRYIELMDDIRHRMVELDRALDRAIERSRKRVEATQEALEDIRARATLMEDGRRAYRTADHKRAFYDDGQELTREQIEKVQWREGAPTWEQRQAAGEAVRQAKQEHEDLKSFKERMDYYHDRMANGDVLSEDDLKDIKTDLDAMPEGLKAEFTGPKADRAGETAGLSEAFTFSAADLADIAQTHAKTTPPRPDYPAP